MYASKNSDLSFNADTANNNLSYTGEKESKYWILFRMNKIAEENDAERYSQGMNFNFIMNMTLFKFI